MKNKIENLKFRDLHIVKFVVYILYFFSRPFIGNTDAFQGKSCTYAESSFHAGCSQHSTKPDLKVPFFFQHHEVSLPHTSTF